MPTYTNHINKPIIILISIIVIVFSSCSVHITKRRYNPGYYVEITHRNKNVKPSRDPESTRTIQTEGLTYRKVQPVKDSLIHTPRIPVPIQVHQQTRRSFNTNCDKIYLTNGKMILGTYIQITDKIFTYKNCGGKSTDVESIDLKKLKYVVLEKGDTIFPQDEAERWRNAHGPTEDKKGNIVQAKRAKTVAVILYSIFGMLIIIGGVFLFLAVLLGAGSGYLGLVLGILAKVFLGFLAFALIIGGIVLIIMAVVTAVRN